MTDVRRDLQGADGPQAVWLSAALLADEPVRVLLQLRTGDVNDRRRRAVPDWHAAPKLHITTFGGMKIRCGEVPVEGAWLDRRAGDLLRYLVVRRERGVTADEIGESLWRAPAFDVVRNVRTCVHRLRGAIEPARATHQAPDYLLTSGASYRLNPHRVEIDADLFEAGVRRGMTLAEDEPEAAVAELERALGRYGGEFFAEAPFAEWALVERARLHDLACDGLVCLVSHFRETSRFDAARQALGRLAGLQPLDERVSRELIELDMECGRHSDAKRRYDGLARMMQESLGYRPRFALADLAPVIDA